MKTNGRTLKEFRNDIYEILFAKYFFNFDFPMNDKDFDNFENSLYFNNPRSDREYAEQLFLFLRSKMRFI